MEPRLQPSAPAGHGEGVGLVLRLRHEGEQTKVVQARVKGHSGLLGFLSSALGMTAPQSVDERDFMLLDDLELTKKDANQRLFKDFDYWFWNH